MIPDVASLLFWVAAGCILAAHLAMLRGLSTARRPAPATGGAVRRVVRADMLWTLIPALLLAVVLAFTWRAIPHDGAPPVPSGIERAAR